MAGAQPKKIILSLCILKGSVIMHRHGMLGEVFPDVLNTEDFMKTPMFRSAAAHAENIGYQIQLSLFKKYVNS